MTIKLGEGDRICDFVTDKSFDPIGQIDQILVDKMMDFTRDTGYRYVGNHPDVLKYVKEFNKNLKPKEEADEHDLHDLLTSMKMELSDTDIAGLLVPFATQAVFVRASGTWEIHTFWNQKKKGVSQKLLTIGIRQGNFWVIDIPGAEGGKKVVANDGQSISFIDSLEDFDQKSFEENSRRIIADKNAKIETEILRLVAERKAKEVVEIKERQSTSRSAATLSLTRSASGVTVKVTPVKDVVTKATAAGEVGEKFSYRKSDTSATVGAMVGSKPAKKNSGRKARTLGSKDLRASA